MPCPDARASDENVVVRMQPDEWCALFKVTGDDDGGFLLFSDIPHNSVMRWDYGKGISVFLNPSGYTGAVPYGLEPGSNGLMLSPQGELVSCEHGDRRGSVLTKAGGKRTLIDNYQGKRLNSPNDLVFKANGDLYFTDQGQTGQHDPTGRVYRLTAKDAKPSRRVDLSKKTAAELLDFLKSDNRWYRETALRLLGDRKDAKVTGALEKMCLDSKGTTALNALWGLNLSGGFNEDVAAKTLDHPEPWVRAWTIRLLGDESDVSATIGQKLAEMAEKDKDIHVRSQLACTARRLPAREALPIIRNLLKHDEDAADIHIPLLVWWALESKCGGDRSDVVKLFADAPIWKEKMTRETVLPRVMRRYAQPGAIKDLETCKELFHLAPDKASGLALLKGFEEAFKGRSVAGLPKDLLAEIDKLGGGSLVFAMRLGRKEAIEQGLKRVLDAKAPLDDRQQLCLLLGEIREPRSVALLLDVVRGAQPAPLKRSALAALENFRDEKIGAQLVDLYARLPVDVKEDAQSLLSSRKEWARAWLEAVEAGKIGAKTIPETALKKALLHKDDRIASLVKKHWGDIKGATTAQMQKEIERLMPVVSSGAGSPYVGKKLFTQHCAACHFLHNHGGAVGPDLTPFKRDDVKTLLINIINPSAEIREGFENHLVYTESGRVITGVLLEKDARVVVLRTAEGQKVALPKEEIAEMRVLGTSLMPEGLLNGLTDQQVRDLFAYLRSTQPLFDR